MSNPTKRVFAAEEIEQKADDYHGGCRYNRTLPDVKQAGVSSVNIEISFEDALKLSMALQSCLMKLNKVKRSTVTGKAMGVAISIKTDNKSISIIEKKLGPEEKEKGA